VAERRIETAPSRLLVMEAGGFEHATRVLLAPWRSAALRYLDAEGAEVRLDLAEVEAEQPGLEEVHRRVTPRMVEVTHPTVAVLLSPQRPAMQDVAVLREFQVQTLVFQDSVLEADLQPELREMEDQPSGFSTRHQGSAGRGRVGPTTYDRCRPIRI
jgi:hypothetical protein